MTNLTTSRTRSFHVAGLLVCGSVLCGAAKLSGQDDPRKDAPEAEVPRSATRDENQTEKRPPSTRDRTVITATRSPLNPLDVPRGTTTYDAENLRELRQVRTLPEALKEAPGISVQRTGHAQGSPKIRGMTGYYTLLLVDGIRINTSIWRSGNVEYWNTIDPWAIDRMELVRGPGSLLYGSDAISGTGQVFARGPLDYVDGDDRVRTRTGLMVRMASAENSFSERAESRGRAGRLGWHAGVTYRDYGHMVAGSSIGELPYTGYHDFDVDAKVAWDLEDWRLTVGFQHVNPEGGPRTHSTVFAKPWRGTTVGSDFLRDIDQQRDMLYVRGETRFSDALRAEFTVSGQRFEESENRVRSNSRRRITEAEVDQLGVQARFALDLAKGSTLSFGVEGWFEGVDSSFREFNPDGSLRSTRLRGAVADDAAYDRVGLYAQLEQDLGERWHLIVGGRGEYTEADADQVDPDGTNGWLPVHRSWRSLVGSVSLRYDASENLRFFGNVHQGFRTPNLADLTRLDVALSGDLEIPSTTLDPERFLTFELGSKYDDGLRRAAITGFFRQGKDLIDRLPTGRIVDGNTEVTKANVNSGYWTGFEFEAATALDFVTVDGTTLDSFEVYAFGDFVSGIMDGIDPADARRIRARKLPPPSGQLGMRWVEPRAQRLTAEFFARAALNVDASEYNAAEIRNTERIPPDGSPSWVTYNVRTRYRISDALSLALSVENITNTDYRIFDSGLNEPGTNVMFTLSATF
ncbi:MAG: TonB-dependent receptor [Planctomycetes bacterium]|nr:TonB-dependent receptor [Planctomycetota bacterium]